MDANSRISNLVNSQVPFFVRNDHQNFVKFLEAYYEWMEQQDAGANTQQFNVITRAKNVRSFNDIDDVTIDQFTNELYKTFIKLIPEDAVADKAIILKNVKDFYRARGTEKSIRFLMRILFDIQDTDFYYPKKDVLRASDGKWFIEKSLKFSDVFIDGNPVSSLEDVGKFVGQTIVGNQSGATAAVERIDTYYEGSTQVRELKISNQTKDFFSGEQISAIYPENGTTRSITANTFSGIVNTVTLTNAGTLYQVGDLVQVEGNTGSGAIVRVDAVTTGNIRSLFTKTGGVGYRVSDLIFITDTTGSGASANVANVDIRGIFHPNSYNIVISFISSEANTNISNSNTVSSIYETFAYSNLATISTNTSNLTVNTGEGASVTTINLSAWKANSNVFFETFDRINVDNTIVLVTSSNTVTDTITVSPGLRGNLVSNTLVILKQANSNTTLANAFSYFTYSNTGPVITANVITSGNNYSPNPVFTTQANTRITDLGILGKMEIIDAGIGYSIGDIINIVNVPGGYGVGAKGEVSNVSSNGAITAVKFVEEPGQYIGGSGYSINYLPEAQIKNLLLPSADDTTNTADTTLVTTDTSGGRNGNLAVTLVLGFGADYTTVSSTLGQILRLSIVSGGSGYEEPPTLNLSSSGDGTAQAVATIVTGVFTYPGRWLNDDGHISSYNFLQDRDYYQNFSYVVKARESIEKYRKALKDLIHPAGMKVFGEYLSVDDDSPVANSMKFQGTNGVYTVFVSGTYVATGNANGTTIEVTTQRDTSNVTNVYIEFLSGDTANIENGLFTATPNTSNSFIIYQPESNTTNATNSTGNVLTSI